MGSNTSFLKEKKDESLSWMFAKLINLRFDAHIAIDAASKYPKNTNKAIDFIQKTKKRKEKKKNQKDFKIFESNITFLNN